MTAATARPLSPAVLHELKRVGTADFTLTGTRPCDECGRVLRLKCDHSDPHDDDPFIAHGAVMHESYDPPRLVLGHLHLCRACALSPENARLRLRLKRKIRASSNFIREGERE